MSTILKCPNPGCPFRFDASAVPPGAVVACPQCRLQFTLGSAPAPAAAVPPLEFPRKRNVIESTTRPGQKTGSSTSVLFALLAVGGIALLLGGGAFVAYLLGAFETRGRTQDPNALQYDDYAITISRPPETWTTDDVTRAALGVKLVAYKRTQPDGWMAVEAKKYDFAAKPAELLTQAQQVLRKQFDELDDQWTPEPTTVFGQPGERYEFHGMYRPTAAACKGVVFACVMKNYAYWLYTWAPRDEYDQLADDFARFRERIQLSVPTGEVAVSKKPEKAFRTQSGLFTLTDREGMWKEMPDPKSQDLTDPPTVELWLRANGRSASTGLPTKEQADLVVGVLTPDGEAKEQAQAYILKQVIGGGTLEEIAGDPSGEAPSGGNVAVSESVVRFRLKYPDTDGSANKLIVVSTVDIEGKRVVAFAYCPQIEARYWEQRLMLIIGTLKAGG